EDGIRDATVTGVQTCALPIFDPVWGLPAEAAVRVLATEGRLINIGSAAGPTVRFESAILRSRLHAILGYTNNALTYEQKAEALKIGRASCREGVKSLVGDGSR